MARVILELGSANMHLYTVRGTQYLGEERQITLGYADEYQYLSIPEEIIDGFIPNHPDVHIKQVPATEELYEKLKNRDYCGQIDSDIREQIRLEYTIEDELKALRIDDFQHKQFVDSLISEGKAKKRAAFGLPLETLSDPLSG